MIVTKLYLYDSGEEQNEYKGQDLSAYVLAGAQNTENLTEELDLTELTLYGYPIRQEFAPETKFIIDIVEDGDVVSTYHRIVQEDVVEQPILADDAYFVHTISLTEPSAIAQKRVVDNIAVTYRLKDVNLEKKTALDLNKNAQTSVTNVAPTPQRGFANYVDSTSFSNTRNTSFGKYFLWKKQDDSDQISIEYTAKDQNDPTQTITVNSTKYYHNVEDIVADPNDGKKKARFELPVPHIMWGVKDPNPQRKPPILQDPAYVDIGVASFVSQVIETDELGNSTVVDEKTFISNSNLGENNVDTTFPFDFAVSSYNDGKEQFKKEYLIEETSYSYVSGEIIGVFSHYTFRFCKYTDIENGINYENTRAYTNDFEIKDNCTYSVNLYVKGNIVNNIPLDMKESGMIDGGRSVAEAVPYENTTLRGFCYSKMKTGFNPYGKSIGDTWNYLPTTNFAPESTFQTYGLGGITQLIESGTPYTAYNLVKRAVMNSDLYFKEGALPVSDFDAPTSPYPFYISNEAGENIITADDLKLIQVNESFFNQKNLWEVLLEVGKYAHAIPQITFGYDDKLAISFYKLGGTDKREDTNTRMSIMNFRKIDDYISACASYVDNLVQLGGVIKEQVAPKTTSEDYLVYNDTAKIIVSKPILEIISIKAKITRNYHYDGGGISGTFTSGQEADITKFIYEQSIYNLLSVRFTDDPNKGIAMYYELGDKEIKGGDYQLPQRTTNAYTDLAFKKILFTAFVNEYITTFDTLGLSSAPWANLKINDFVFEVVYRTKDTARLEHTRPDLRHYLLTTKHDRAPYHKQFNNQQDILVDSAAFGGSMFGKLIRTGNSNYKTQEWCEGYGTMKHKGELYVIDGEWYYVAKVTNIFFPDHIESIIEYSKDYNQLSEIIGIPSEPRFYEISERSTIDREIAINDYLLVTTDENNLTNNSFIKDLSHTKNLVFGNTYGGNANFLKWAVTKFKGDPNLTNEQGTFGLSDFEKTVMSPINAYSSGNTLTYEWDMVDNFSAGDEVSEEKEATGNTAYNAYRTMRAVQYCDKFGKAALFDFEIYGDLELTDEQVRNLPKSPIYIKTYNEIQCQIDLSQEPYSQTWLKDMEGNIPTFEDGTTYYVDRVHSYMFVDQSLLAATVNVVILSTDPIPDENTILARIENRLPNPTDGDTVLVEIENQRNSGPRVFRQISLYKYRTAAPYNGDYEKIVLFDGGYFDGYFYFTFNRQNMEYEDKLRYKIDLSETPYSSTWLRDNNGNVPTLRDGDTFEVLYGDPFVDDTMITAIVRIGIFDTDPIPSEEEILQAIAEEIQSPADGDIAIVVIANAGTSPTEYRQISYYTYNSSATSYEKTVLFNGGEFLDKFLFEWDEERDKYVEQTSSNAIVTNRKVGINKSIVLIKDSRETLHFNYNVMQITDSDRFVISPFFFEEKENYALIAVLSEEVNKLSNGYINNSTVLATITPAPITVDGDKIVVDMRGLKNLSSDIKAKSKSIVIMESGQSININMSKFIIARNEAITENLSDYWYFGAPDKNALWTKQKGNMQ